MGSWGFLLLLYAARLAVAVSSAADVARICCRNVQKSVLCVFLSSIFLSLFVLTELVGRERWENIFGA